MKNVFLFAALIGLIACSSETETVPVNPEQTPTVDSTAVTVDSVTTLPAVTASVATED